MISTWTTFQIPAELPIDVSIFAPLLSADISYHRALYGRFHESPGDCLLFIAWESLEEYEAFAKTDEYLQLMANMKSATSDGTAEPKTQIVDFGQIEFWEDFGHDVEILTAYFPSSISPQDQEAVVKIRPLVNTLAPLDWRGNEALTYKRRPVCGWAKDLENFDGQSVLASKWCHYWKDKANEDRFKTTEKRPPFTMQGPQGPLALTAFERDLEEMGAVGWTRCHVDFKFVPGSSRKMKRYMPDHG